MPHSSSQEEQVRGPDGKLLERHLYRRATGATLRADTVVLLDDEDKSEIASVQTAFEHSEGLIIEGGFYGINARSAATKYAEMQMHRQLERDRAQYELEREKLALERERQQAELEIARMNAQSSASLAWANSAQAQYIPTNGYPGLQGSFNFYGQPMTGHQFGPGYGGQTRAYPPAPGPPLHSRSETDVPSFPEPHPAPSPFLPRAQTDSQIRPAPQFAESEITEGGTTPHRRLEEILPDAPRHTPQGHWRRSHT